MPSAPSKSTYAINSKGQWLNGNAAASYLRMLAAGCPAGGISGKGAGRTYAEQAALYAFGQRVHLCLDCVSRLGEGFVGLPGRVA